MRKIAFVTVVLILASILTIPVFAYENWDEYIPEDYQGIATGEVASFLTNFRPTFLANSFTVLKIAIGLMAILFSIRITPKIVRNYTGEWFGDFKPPTPENVPAPGVGGDDSFVLGHVTLGKDGKKYFFDGNGKRVSKETWNLINE